MKFEHTMIQSTPLFQRFALSACASAVLTLTSPARAADEVPPPWILQPAIKATLSATTNGNGAPSGEEKKDIFASVQPKMFLQGESSGYRLKALLGADMIAYTRGSQANRMYPVVDVDGSVAIVKQFFFLDSSVSVGAAERNPYAARSETGSSQNSEVVSVYRVSPNINYDVSTNSNLSARYEEVLTRGDEGSATNQRFSNASVALSRKPQPLGGALQYESHVIRFSAPGNDEWRIESLKAVGDAKVTDDLILGPVVGSERTEFAQESRRGGLYGMRLLWSPSDRTRLAAEVDHRFFGTGWEFDLRHRGTAFTVSARWIREPVTSSTTLGTASSGSALGSFLDQLLFSRYPDPSQRSSVVSSLIANRGLAVEQLSPIDIRASYAQLRTDARVAIVFLGSRNIVSISAYDNTRRALFRSGDALDQLTSNSADNNQKGLSFDFNRKLSPQLSMDIASNWSRIRGVGLLGNEMTEEQTYRLSLVRGLSPQTGISVGIQYDRLDTSALTATSYRATSAFVGMNHKF